MEHYLTEQTLMQLQLNHHYYGSEMVLIIHPKPNYLFWELVNLCWIAGMQSIIDKSLKCSSW